MNRNFEFDAEGHGLLGKKTVVKRKKHVLIVDDEVPFRFAASLVLRVSGYTVSEAGNGEEALEVISLAISKREKVDLLLMDIQMPGITGIELLDCLKDSHIHIPTLIITGFLDERLIKELVKRNRIDYIEKPFRPEDLLSWVNNILS